MAIIGIVLMIPGMLWARYKLKRTPDSSSGKHHVTKFGFIYSILHLLCLLSTLELREFFPQVSPGMNFLIFIIVFVSGSIGAVVFQRMGIKSFVNPYEKNV